MQIDDMFEFVNKALPKKEKIVFEIGAYNGDSVPTIIGRLSPIKEYHAFEPDARNFKSLLDKLSNSKFITKANFCAIGAIDGKINFYPSDSLDIPGSPKKDWSASGSIREPNMDVINLPWLIFNEKTEVDVITLDTYCLNNNITNIDFIWADVQGAEEDLILGGKNTLKNTKFLFTEYCDSQIYKDEIDKNGILKLLPEWELIHDFGTDLFLMNKSI